MLLHLLGRLGLLIVGLVYGFVAYWMGLAIKEAHLPIEAWNTAEAAIGYTWIIVVLFSVGCVIAALRPLPKEAAMNR